MQTLGSLRNYHQGVFDKEREESGQPTRRKHAHVHTHEGGGVDSQKMADLKRNWTIQSPLTPRNGEDKGDMGLMGLEDITTEELNDEFDRLQLTPSGPQSSKSGRFLAEPPPTDAKLHAS